MRHNNLNNSVTTLLNKYSIEDILFTLHSNIDNKLKNTNNQHSDKLQLQVQALDRACELLEDADEDNTFYLVY